MEANAAFVRANGVVELHTITEVHMHFAAVVYPGHSEGEDAVGLNQTLYDFCPFKFGVFVVDIFDGNEHFANGLEEFGFTGVLRFESLHNQLCFHDEVVF